jgi:hypothetical protein
MRATVGPLPAAVYWRRRAVVLGALLLGVIVLFVSCSGGGDDTAGKRGTGVSSQQPSPSTAASEPEEEASFSDPGPGAGNPPLPDPSEVTGSGDGTGPDDDTDDGTSDTNVTVPASGLCTDAEMSVTPVPAAATVRRGATVAIRLKIKNISGRTCSRDVGADLQELYIEQGAEKVWSSDTCGNAKGSDVRVFAPSGERIYDVTWNGKQSNRCTAGLATGTAPPVGQYVVRGRLGSKVSAPVALDVTA